MSINTGGYKNAGVDIQLAEDLLTSVKSTIRKTHRKEVIDSTNLFGGLFQLDLTRYREPVLVTSIDGVGTKLLLANVMNTFRSIGFDLVNHCINDIACQGAEPLYFMDYLGIGKLRSPLFEEIITGLAEACQSHGVTLLGGETAEMPGMYGQDYDLVGAITGVVEKPQLITGEKIQAGNAIVGLGSNGLHTNGFSLARNILFEKCNYSHNNILNESNETLGQILMKPHLCYWPAIKRALDKELPIHGIAHITGGGFYGNIPRILPDNLDAIIDRNRFPCPDIFTLIQQKGEISDYEMYKVFNMGIGMVWVVQSDIVESAISICRNAGFIADYIGEIVNGSKKVGVKGLEEKR